MAPASKIVCASVRPSDQTFPDVPEQRQQRSASAVPYDAVSPMFGKYAARWMPICAFAAATARSAAAISGRRCKSAEGTTSGTPGTRRVPRCHGNAELARRLADEQRNRVLEPRARAGGRRPVRAGRTELRLRLQHVGALRDAGVVLVLRDLPCALVRGHRIGQQRDLVVGFAQCKIVGGERRLCRQCRGGEIRRTRLCTRLRPRSPRGASGPRCPAPSSP